MDDMTDMADTTDAVNAMDEQADLEGDIEDIIEADITAADALQGFDPRAIELAEDVLNECRTSLMMAYRFLNVALWRMPFKPAAILAPIECDGETFWYNPFLVLYRFRQDANELVRDMLHGIIHCILRHPFDSTHETTRAWWLACDMATEAMCMEMAGTAFPNELDGLRTMALNKFRSLGAVIAPERLYQTLELDVRWMEVKPTEAAEVIKSLEFLFDRDSHAHWPQRGEESNGDDTQTDQDSSTLQDDSAGMAKPSSADCATDSGGADNDSEEKDGSNGGSDSSEQEARDDASCDECDPSENPEDETTEAYGKDDEEMPEPGGVGEDEDTSTDNQEDELGHGPAPLDSMDVDQRALKEQEWADLSKSIQEDLETFSRLQGTQAATFLANVAISNRKSVDYADFLRRFARLHEDMRVNDEEFDYLFYTYGLDLYGNMPLVEPLEYQEVKRVRNFVVAIDTSSSCSEALVRHFIDRTFQILTETEELRGAVNVHIIQCDAAIREDTKITSLEELKEFNELFQVKGRGGTDFRPVFEYVDDLLAAGEFDDLGGLIYFTDGYGTFPARPPDYQTAFVFVEDGGDPRTVPPWAMRVVLRSEQVSIV